MERFVKIETLDGVTEHGMLTAIEHLDCIGSATLVDCTAENVEKTEEVSDCLIEIARELYKLENRDDMNCPLRVLREQIEMQLGRDVTRNTHR
jgi:adenylate kinase